MSETKLNIQPGDMVRLKPVRVISINTEGDPFVKFGPLDARHIPTEFIESVEPRPLEVGDFVTRHGWDGKWSIVAINGGNAWIVSQDVSHAIAHLSHLTRVDQ